jgi:hypothetical protein
MWKPEVGQKYLCVCNHRTIIKEGDVLVVVKDNKDFNTVKLQNISTGYELSWAYEEFPDDFKLVEWTTEHGHFTNYPSENTPSSHVKPPLGLQPQSIHDNLRVKDILAAMQRYVAANKPVPNEWLEELIDKIELKHE